MLNCFMTPSVYCPNTLHFGGGLAYCALYPLFFLEQTDILDAVISNTKVCDDMFIKLHSSDRCFKSH